MKYNKENDETNKIALLLNAIAKTLYENYSTFIFPVVRGSTSRTVKDVLDKYDEYNKPYHNVALVTFVFNKLLQSKKMARIWFHLRLKLNSRLTSINLTLIT